MLAILPEAGSVLRHGVLTMLPGMIPRSDDPGAWPRKDLAGDVSGRARRGSCDCRSAVTSPDLSVGLSINGERGKSAKSPVAAPATVWLATISDPMCGYGRQRRIRK